MLSFLLSFSKFKTVRPASTSSPRITWRSLRWVSGGNMNPNAGVRLPPSKARRDASFGLCQADRLVD